MELKVINQKNEYMWQHEENPIHYFIPIYH
jgi:hypothetical protein